VGWIMPKLGVFQYLSKRLPVPHFRPFGTA